MVLCYGWLDASNAPLDLISYRDPGRRSRREYLRAGVSGAAERVINPVQGASSVDDADVGEFLPKLIPSLIVMSGPSGVGKDAIMAQLKELGRPFHFAVTATTRSPRANEVDGVDYYFVDQAGFEEMIANDALLEHAEVYGNHYGVPKAPVRQALLQGQDVIVRVDVQGVVNLQRVVPEAIYIFIAPPSMGALKDRILHRAADRPDDIERRMGNAVDEMKAVDRFDYVITNYEGELEIAVAQLDAIVVAEKCRVVPRNLEI